MGWGGRRTHLLFSSLDGRKEAKEDQGVRDASQVGRVHYLEGHDLLIGRFLLSFFFLVFVGLDDALHEPVAAGTRVAGRGVVVTEGNYLALNSLGWEGARERIDLLIMVEVDEAELIRRLVARHMSFGRHRAEAGHWVRAVDLPNARLVADCANRCDEVWRIGR